MNKSVNLKVRLVGHLHLVKNVIRQDLLIIQTKTPVSCGFFLFVMGLFQILL